MTNEITFEVLNADGSITYEKTRVIKFPVGTFKTEQEFFSFVSKTFDSLPPAPEVVVLI